MNGDEITNINESLPRIEYWFPKEMKWWHKILCFLGKHKWETRQTGKGHCYGFQTEEGIRKGIYGLHDENPMKLRGQCGRCNVLSDE